MRPKIIKTPRTPISIKEIVDYIVQGLAGRPYYESSVKILLDQYLGLHSITLNESQRAEILDRLELRLDRDV